MTTVGRWSPNKVRARVLDGTWVSAEELGGMVLLTPTSIAYTGTSASIGANGSVGFSACLEVQLNGIFTADYDNYMMVIRGTSSANDYLDGRLCSSGIAATASNYVYQNIYADSTTVAGSRSGAVAVARLGNCSNIQRWGITAYIFGPHLAQPTAIRSTTALDYASAYIEDFVSTHSLSNSYDGFTLRSRQTQNHSGLVSVYGLVGA